MEAGQGSRSREFDDSELCRCLFDESDDAILIVDGDARCIVETNTATLRVTGLQATQLLGTDVRSILLAADGFDQAIERFLATGIFRYDSDCSLATARNGSVPVRLRLSRLGLEAQPILVVARVIPQDSQATLSSQQSDAAAETRCDAAVGAEQTAGPVQGLTKGEDAASPPFRADTASERQTQLFEAIFENASDGIVVLDASGNFLQFNRAARQMLGFGAVDLPFTERPEYYGAFLADQQTPLPVDELPLRRALQGEEVRGCEIYIRNRLKPDGAWCSINASPLRDRSGNIYGAVGTYRDISDRKTAETALRASQEELQLVHERLELAVTGTSDGLWDWDIATGQVWISPGAMELLGEEPREHTADHAAFQDLLHPDDFQGVRDAISRHFSEAEPFKVETRLRITDGGYRWFASRGIAVRDDAGTPVRMSGALRDITESRQAAQAAARSQREATRSHEQLIEAIESLTEGFALYDADDRLVICNSKYREFYDVSRDLLVPGAKFEDHIRTSAYRGQIADAVGREEEWVRERVRQHQNPQGKYLQHLGSGQWLQVSERRMRDGGIVGVRTDITDRILAEESLRASESMFRSLTESSPALVAIFQGTHHAYVNPEFSSYLGYTHDELMAMSFIDYTHPDDRELVRQRSLERQRGEQVESRYEIRLLTKDGEERWADFGGTRVEFQGEPAVLGVALDITAQRRAERELRESEEMSRTLLENHVDGVVVTVQGRIEYANEPMVRLSGGRHGSLIGLLFEELVAAAEVTQPADAGGGVPKSEVTETEVRHRDGHLVPVEVVSRPIRLKGEQAILTVVRDISWRKKLEEEARQHRDLLARANRVSMLGEMATGLAHELNQPLAAIAMLADACRLKLETGGQDVSVLDSILQTLSQQSVRAGAIVDRIRKFIGKEEFVWTDCRADELVNGVLSILAAEIAEHECEVDAEISDGLPLLFVDRVQIEQVLVNLIHNAIDAYRESGAAQRRVVVRVGLASENFSEWSVTDSGPGMSQAAAGRVFDAFYSTKQKGMGMGLAICRTIVEAHGGRIDVESRPGNGVTFKFTLPTTRRKQNGGQS